MKINSSTLILAGLCLLVGVFCYLESNNEKINLPEDVAEALKNLPDELDYNIDVKPILSDKCFSCHGPDSKKQKGGLRLDDFKFAYNTVTESGLKAIAPGNPDKSEIMQLVLNNDPDLVMPKPSSHLSLSAKEKATLYKWIDNGARYKPHWAFVPAAKPSLPSVKNKLWIKNDIDNFILNRLEKEGLQPSAEADNETLIRRVSFDLTGLPPPIKDIDVFINDKSPNAYEKMVNRYLQSPHYGERMAAYWLDVAHFADSYGYLDDKHRDASPWRDWLINAYNKNLSFDKFITWQLAGDILPNATQEQILATGFNRNHRQNSEAGIIEEEFRVEYVVDRTNTLGKGIMGLTMECAKCHDHKYDPISQKDYYSMFAFFNSTMENGSPNLGDKNILPGPTLILKTKEDEQKINNLIKFIKEAENKKNAASKPVENPQQSLSKKAIVHISFEKTEKGFSYNKETGKSSPDIVYPNKFNKPLSATISNIKNGNGVVGKSLFITPETFVALPAYKIAYFERYEPFAISLWVKLPGKLKEGTIFQNADQKRYGFQGYDLIVKDNHLNFRLTHSFPHECISVQTEMALDSNKWYHIGLSYDGSSKGKGVTLFIDAKRTPVHVEYDNLYKNMRSYMDIQKYPIDGFSVGSGTDRTRSIPGGEVDELYIFNNELTDSEAQFLYNKQSVPVWKGKKTQDEDNKQLYLYRKGLCDVYDSLKQAMVMGDLPSPRPTHVLKRGVYDNYGDEVQPGTPASILPYPKSFPKNRLGLAQWLFLPNNPLTGRVAVNRIWEFYFGRSLVKTTDNFGSQGEMPSHPELLDYLTVAYRENGWDTKALQKMILMSATYRQNSLMTPLLQEKDPQNILLARASKFRMPAEMIRDNALSISNLLVDKIGGKSVYPYQPDSLWEALTDKVWRYKYLQDSSEGLYRRSIYTIRKRTSAPPSLLIFDATDRNNCVVGHLRSSSPLQALVLLNDPQFIEAARFVAKRMMAETNNNLSDELIFGFRLVTGRKPLPKELVLLNKMYQTELKVYEDNPDKAKKILSVGQKKLYNDKQFIKVAALSDVVLALFNTDEFIARK